MIEWWPIRVTLPGRSEVSSKHDGCVAARSESETKKCRMLAFVGGIGSKGRPMVAIAGMAT
jgi:hypothetical protein